MAQSHYMQPIKTEHKKKSQVTNQMQYRQADLKGTLSPAKLDLSVLLIVYFVNICIYISIYIYIYIYIYIVFTSMHNAHTIEYKLTKAVCVQILTAL